MSATTSANVSRLDSGFSGSNSVTWSDPVVRVNSDISIEYKSISSKSGIADGELGISERKIPENGKVQQPSSDPWD